MQEPYKRDKYLGCPPRKILGSILEVDKRELKQMDQRIRTLMTVHKALYLTDEVDRLYAPRKEGGRRFAIIEDSVDASIHRLEDYVEKRGGRLIRDQKQY